MKLAPWLAGLLVASQLLAGGVVVIKHTSGPDVTAPNAITDLAVTTQTASTCTLTFSAPYDDAPTSGGAVAAYDCRVCTQATCSTTMDGTEYTSATLVSNEPTPAAPTTGESFAATVAGGLTQSTAYVFNCKSTDEVPNTSGLSNDVLCTTTGAQFTDDFSGTLGSWTQLRSSSSWAINSAHLVGPTTASNGAALVYNTAASPTSSVYASIQLTSTINDNIGLILHSSGSATPGESIADAVYYTGGKLFWSDVGNDGAYFDDIAQCDATPTSNQYLLAKITGTGQTRSLDVWIQATGGIPSGTPLCHFDGASLSATCNCTGTNCASDRNDGAGGHFCLPSAVTGGFLEGIWQYDSASNPDQTYDNFAGGGL